MLRTLLIALDARLTGNQPAEIERFLDRQGLDPDDPISALLETDHRLSDGGNSRLHWNPAHGSLSLTHDSLATCKLNWIKAEPERRALEAFLRKALYREDPHLYPAA